MEPVLLAHLCGHQEKVEREKLILEVVGAFHSTAYPGSCWGTLTSKILRVPVLGFRPTVSVTHGMMATDLLCALRCTLANVA